MHYTYDYKVNAVNLYHEGKWPQTPDGIDQKWFRKTIRRWVRLVDENGFEILKHKSQKHSIELKYTLVSKVLMGNSVKSVAISAGINDSVLQQWVRNYEIYGYNGLIPNQKGHVSKNPSMKKVGTRKPPKPNESEYEELVRLRAENEYMKAEIEVIKKEIALREQKEAARLKAKKQQSSKSSVEMDIN